MSRREMLEGDEDFRELTDIVNKGGSNDGGRPIKAEKGRNTKSRNKSSRTASSSRSGGSGAGGQKCPKCQGRHVEHDVSNTERNPGREFFKCGNRSCRAFIGWVDDSKENSNNGGVGRRWKTGTSALKGRSERLQDELCYMIYSNALKREVAR